ncbi:MAG: fasciclin domain-containing protein [Ferruginibacter sp.]|nr:fasciclin domain-containing protein [Ferruginibacter sp.]
MQTSLFTKWLSSLKVLATIALMAGIMVSCKKSNDMISESTGMADNEQAAVNTARALEQSAVPDAKLEAESLGFSELTNETNPGNIVDIAVSNPNFTSLVAAVLKTGLAGALSNPSANLTVFAPTNGAFAQLPAPFNNAANINGISDATQVDFLRNVLLYHVLGAEVFSNQVSNGSSSAATLKAATSSSINDNTIYLSKTFGLIKVNGQSSVIYANLNASNGVIHVINKVLLFPTNTIAGIAIADPNFSSLVAALVKTNLAGVFTGSGDFTVFAPTNAAFAQLPAPFNNASNISSITDAGQVAALANILKYHVAASRNFTWDLGILRRVTTLANAPRNKVTTILGFNTGWVKGDDNNSYAQINPADILATNGVIHVIGKVLLPK